MYLHLLAADSDLFVGLDRRILLIRLVSAALMSQSGAAHLQVHSSVNCSPYGK